DCSSRFSRHSGPSSLFPATRPPPPSPPFPYTTLFRSIALETMLRIHFMQQWFAYSDPAMEEALHDIPLLREFAGLDATVEAIPRSEEHTSELQSRENLVCRLLLEKKKEIERTSSTCTR